jgi:arylformamidase
MLPDRPQILARWKQDSLNVRSAGPALCDLLYGESPDERLDFFPADRRGAPLLVFIHGGWWRSLDKSDFSFIAPAYTGLGINIALTNYSLAPAVSIQEIVRQQLRALVWLYRNAHKYHFDRQCIMVAGHSAGGHLAAMMLAALWPNLEEDLPTDLVKAGILMSGLYDLDAVRQADFINVDLKLTPENIGPISPAWMPKANRAPFITAVGDLESDEFKRQNELLGQRWSSHHLGDIALPGIHHLTICDAFATPGQPLFDAAVKLITNFVG